MSTDAFVDEVWVFWSQFCGIEACNNTNKGEVACNIVAPMILPKALAKDIVKLSLWSLSVNNQMWFGLLVQ